MQATAYFADEQRCIDLLKEFRWRNGIKCPHCKYDKAYELNGAFKGYKCCRCKRNFSIINGTIFEKSQLPLSKWFVAIYVVITRKKGVSAAQLSRDINVTYNTAWFMIHRIRWMLMSDYKNKLSGYVEIDESYLGGKNKNRHPDKKVKGAGGRSCKDKAPIIGIVSPEEYEYRERPSKKDPSKTVLEKVVTKPAQLICRATRDVRVNTIKPLIYKNVELGSIIVTDEYNAYKGLQGNYQHRFVVHRIGEYVNDEGFTTNRIENAWTHLKGMYIGTYRYISRKHLQRYLEEYCFRYNNRHLDNDRISLLSKAFANVERRLTWSDLVRKNTA